MTSLSYTQNVKKCHGNAHATPWCTSAQAELVFGTKYTVIIRDTSFGLYYTLPTSGKGVSIFYNQQIDESDWADQWFFMAGRVHPFALTWELETRDGLESDNDSIIQYTIPAFVVRELSFQPYVL